MKLGLLAKKKEEEEKRLCEKKRGPEASLNKHRRVKIYEFPIMPFNQFIGYYSLPLYFWAKAVNTSCYISNRVFKR